MKKFNEEEYDFLRMGARCAVEGLANLNQTAVEIGNLYGEQARLEFEAGIANMISTYSKCNKSKKVTKKEIVGSTANYQVSGLRNDSYFGEELYGEVSSQVIKDEDGFDSYNEPKTKKIFIKKENN